MLGLDAQGRKVEIWTCESLDPRGRRWVSADSLSSRRRTFITFDCVAPLELLFPHTAYSLWVSIIGLRAT